MFSEINFKKAALSGGVASAAGYLLFGESGGSIPIAGFDVPPPLVIFGSVASASVITDEIHKRILPMISEDKKIENVESLAVGGAISGLASSAALRASGVPSSNMIKSFGLGAGSYLIGDYTYYRLLYPDQDMAF